MRPRFDGAENCPTRPERSQTKTKLWQACDDYRVRPTAGGFQTGAKGRVQFVVVFNLIRFAGLLLIRLLYRYINPD
jgi:hypothetical protein